jgi:hypothetical protein
LLSMLGVASDLSTLLSSSMYEGYTNGMSSIYMYIYILMTSFIVYC